MRATSSLHLDSDQKIKTEIVNPSIAASCDFLYEECVHLSESDSNLGAPSTPHSACHTRLKSMPTDGNGSNTRVFR